MNDFYNSSGYPAPKQKGDSAPARSEFSAIEDGFDKMPALAGNGDEPVYVNSAGTGLVTIPNIGIIARRLLDLNSGSYVLWDSITKNVGGIIYSEASSNGVFTVPEAGWYLATLIMRVVNNTGVAVRLSPFITCSPFGVNLGQWGGDLDLDATANARRVSIAALLYLNAGDEVYCVGATWGPTTFTLKGSSTFSLTFLHK